MLLMQNSRQQLSSELFKKLSSYQIGLCLMFNDGMSDSGDAADVTIFINACLDLLSKPISKTCRVEPRYLELAYFELPLISK